MPNSILWIGLVVLWVFVLFPILADRHPRIRRTTDTALATRVLHRGDSKRRKGGGRARKKRPTRSHRKRHHGNDAEDPMSTAEETVTAPDEERLEGADDFAGAAADSDLRGESDAGSASARDRYDAEEFTGAEPGIPDTVPARIPPDRKSVV